MHPLRVWNLCAGLLVHHMLDLRRGQVQQRNHGVHELFDLRRGLYFCFLLGLLLRVSVGLRRSHVELCRLHYLPRRHNCGFRRVEQLRELRLWQIRPVFRVFQV